MFPSTDSPKNAVDIFPRTDTLKWHSFYPLKPCGDGGIDVKENKIIGYKSVEINGFWGFRRNPKSHFSI